MNLKKALTLAVAGMIAFSAATGTQAATRDELAAIKVSKGGNFRYWTKNSAALKELRTYVKDVTNKGSKNFIPVEDRIAVFDMDGTLLCETAPFYFDWMFYEYRINDPYSHANVEDRNKVKAFRKALSENNVTDEMDAEKNRTLAKSLSGMTQEEFKSYVQNYMRSTYVEGLSNLKTGESFYMPMVEVVSYLNANDFTVYIVSGCERGIIRALVDGVMDIEPNHIIGSDYSYKASRQGDERADSYLFTKNDELQRGDKIIDINLNSNKVFAIAREIGKQPVLAFGNSMGDSSMFNYTITNNKYRSAAFVLLCDDNVREFGNLDKAYGMKQTAKEQGWIAVSMKNDFKTIYGNNVKRTDK